MSVHRSCRVYERSEIHHDPGVGALRCAYAPYFAAIIICLILTTPAFADEPAKKAADNLDLPTMLFVFMLASFIGLGVITRVSRLLHTPLMSLTNAISAIAVIGAITIAGADHVRPGAEHAGDRYPLYITLLGAIALFASTTNIVSGFLLTDRMLKMFKKKPEPTQP